MTPVGARRAPRPDRPPAERRRGGGLRPLRAGGQASLQRSRRLRPRGRPVPRGRRGEDLRRPGPGGNSRAAHRPAAARAGDLCPRRPAAVPAGVRAGAARPATRPPGGEIGLRVRPDPRRRARTRSDPKRLPAGGAGHRARSPAAPGHAGGTQLRGGGRARAGRSGPLVVAAPHRLAALRGGLRAAGRRPARRRWRCSGARWRAPA